MNEIILAQNNLIYKVISGSNAYGTNTKDSDKDYMGIFIPTEDYVLGLYKCDQVELGTKNHSLNQKNTKEDIDFTVYNLVKFIHLAIGNNPNIIELFFMPKNCIIYKHPIMDELLSNYKLFISKKAFHTFTGYAYSQRKKLEVKKENMTGRVELVEQYGYDTKFASHLIRLLLEGWQILVEGKITLPLTQNNLILDIKKGKYDLQWILNKADSLEDQINTAYSNSKLQHSADIEKINDLQKYLLKKWWKEYESR